MLKKRVFLSITLVETSGFSMRRMFKFVSSHSTFNIEVKAAIRLIKFNKTKNSIHVLAAMMTSNKALTPVLVRRA